MESSVLVHRSVSAPAHTPDCKLCLTAAAWRIPTRTGTSFASWAYIATFKLLPIPGLPIHSVRAVWEIRSTNNLAQTIVLWIKSSITRRRCESRKKHFRLTANIHVLHIDFVTKLCQSNSVSQKGGTSSHFQKSLVQSIVLAIGCPSVWLLLHEAKMGWRQFMGTSCFP